MGLLSAFEADAASSDRVRLSLGQEYAECLVYYQLGTVAAQKAGNLPMAQQGQQFADDDLKMALILLPPKFVKADAALASLYEGSILNKEGFAPLISKYAHICREGLENPEARIEYWQNTR